MPLGKWKDRNVEEGVLGTRIVRVKKKTSALYVACRTVTTILRGELFYVHGTVHLSNTSHINTEMQFFLFSLFGVRTLHVSEALLRPSSGAL